MNRSDFKRLKTLYEISKKLSTFTSVEESFAQILTSAAESFPLLSAVLIEHWENPPHTAVWFSPDVSQERVEFAVLNAKNTFSYLTDASAEEAENILKQAGSVNELVRGDRIRASTLDNQHNYIVLPLMIDDLAPRGVLQLEGAEPLDEKDLEFVSALANLMSVALDRIYIAKVERSVRREEAKNNLASIKLEKGKVLDLEAERGLREAFVSLLTHDLKTPLSVMRGAAELIQRKNDSTERSKTLAEMIIGQSRRVEKMINNLLDANKISSGEKLGIRMETIDLNQFVSATIDELKLIHAHQFILEADHTIQQLCDPSSIRRIIENLCSNAVKYGFKEAAITITLKESEWDVQIAVNNKGEIIPEEDQPNIFEQFRRTQTAVHGSSEGWGIGLTLVRGMAEAHGGRVTIKSEPISGTTFTVILPKPNHPTT